MYVFLFNCRYSVFYESGVKMSVKQSGLLCATDLLAMTAMSHDSAMSLLHVHTNTTVYLTV